MADQIEEIMQNGKRKKKTEENKGRKKEKWEMRIGRGKEKERQRGQDIL